MTGTTHACSATRTRSRAVRSIVIRFVFFSLVFVLSAASARQVVAQSEIGAGSGGKLPNPIFAFNNCIKDDKDPKYDTPEEQVRVLKELGFDGMEKNGLDNFAEVQSELDRQGLKLYTVYVNVNLDPNKPAYDARLPEVVRSLKGRDTMLWLNITSRDKTFASSDRAGDRVALPLLHEIADMASASDLRIMLYPHARFWLETVPHSIDLVKAVKRPNIGLTFNLVHWLALTKPEDEKQLKSLLKQAKPYLYAVSLNGATNNEEDKTNQAWTKLIQPLGQGTFDTRALVRMLREINFKGPIGLQCYNIKGDKRDNLQTSITAWRQHRQVLVGKS